MKALLLVTMLGATALAAPQKTVRPKTSIAMNDSSKSHS
ncbi:MAG: hypothetical protein JWM94_179 [Sphingomonas bacterium]|nr:hypothetical protein [Sphingomonas bacterium]MDB5711061.1 hypothetical protein [Sphingomonas bacterium]